MVIAELLNLETNTKVYAEVRVFKKDDKMVVLAKDYETARLIPVDLTWNGTNFTSEDGNYQTDFQWTEEIETPTRLTTIHKK
jgi:DNA-binding GntR family transcriptional regulator